MPILNDRKACNDSFDDYFADSIHQVGILFVLEDRSDQSFVTFLILWVNIEGMVLFVDSVVCEMGELIGQIIFIRLLELLGCKTNYAIFVDKNSQRVHTGYQNINSQILSYDRPTDNSNSSCEYHNETLKKLIFNKYLN